MTDPNDPLKDGLTPKDYDEYGDMPQQEGSQKPKPEAEPKDEPNAGDSPLG